MTAQVQVDTPGDPFTVHRALLFTVAYEMLGSASDAEDVLQEAWLRWSAADVEDVRNPRAYAVRIVTRLSLNRMRTVSRRRETYVGPWLPEPIGTSPDVADDVVLAESVSLAMLVVLDSLGPVERAVFVLHEVFGFTHDEIAGIVDRSTGAVRQIAHRSREHVAAKRPRQRTDPAMLEAVTARFVTAAQTGDVTELLAMVAPDVVLVTDGGGVKQAARRPIVGADKVLRFLLGVHSPAVEIGVVQANGESLITLSFDGVIDTAMGLAVVADQVQEIYVVRNPAKLERIGHQAVLSR